MRRHWLDRKYLMRRRRYVHIPEPLLQPMSPLIVDPNHDDNGDFRTTNSLRAGHVLVPLCQQHPPEHRKSPREPTIYTLVVHLLIWICCTLGENFVGFDTVTYNKSTILTYNYAYGGATIDANLVVPYLPFVHGPGERVPRWRGEKNPDVAVDEREHPVHGMDWWVLFFLLKLLPVRGSYYLSGDRNAFSDTLLNAYFALVQKLVGAGGRNFLLINVPPIDRSPLMLAQAASAQALEKTVIAGFNTKLAAKIASFKANNTGVTTWLWDSNAAFTTILNAPTQFGFIDAVSYGNTGDFWGNDYHPSSAAHQIFGKEISTLLAGTPWF
ncbi:hypothetical protein B0H10DRAFT_1371991 [Mycena sp. CBHHK59/15]|nr:hypothetical protein B0H10DRAFT_1371991 [Mycena sp. CBHHK59/15]